MAAIFSVGLLASSWVGTFALGVGEWVIRKLPLARHIYGAAKQVSAALRPAEGGAAGSFRECVLVKHPRLGSYMVGFVTGTTTLTGVGGGGAAPSAPSASTCELVVRPTFRCCSCRSSCRNSPNTSHRLR